MQDLGIDAGVSKAQLARDIGRDDAVVRRLFTADVNLELRTIAALAAALDAKTQIVRRRKLRTPRAGRAATPRS
jgi:ribosome-binding protein aMBF1 (putative translation factor)